MSGLLLAAAALALAVGGGLVHAGVGGAVALHGALMLTAWGLLLPAGGVVARYFKVTPRQDFPHVVENLTWWRWHQVLQYTGVALASVAFVTILSETGGRVATLHGRLGLLVMSLGWLQVLATLFRGSKGGPTDKAADPDDPTTWRGDHYDMTPRRRAFEAWHKPAGWGAIALASVTILLGTELVGSPDWLVLLAGCLAAGLGLALLDGIVRRRWVDTYAALWGLDRRHPGNRAGTTRAARARAARPVP